MCVHFAALKASCLSSMLTENKSIHGSTMEFDSTISTTFCFKYHFSISHERSNSSSCLSDMPELQRSNKADLAPLRPVFTPTVERTRDFSVKPLPAGLRYGNFSSVRTLPHVGRGHVAGQHFVPYFNNQQLFRKVWEWFEAWTPWQQKMLLCGLTNRSTYIS